MDRTEVCWCRVSIPSERESAFQVRFSVVERLGLAVSIPSERESAFQVSIKQVPVGADLAVSIPSERESAFQAKPISTPMPMIHCFNSLRAGKCISRINRRIQMFVGMLSFNSLRAGKCISSWDCCSCAVDLRWFQFPPSGKVHFKDEQRSHWTTKHAFQFPPSGKVHFKYT